MSSSIKDQASSFRSVVYTKLQKLSLVALTVFHRVWRGLAPRQGVGAMKSDKIARVALLCPSGHGPGAELTAR